MVPSSRLAFIGNSLPRQCGIATFTTDLQQAVAKSRAHIETAIVAMTDHGHTYSYPGVVRLQINDEHLEEYGRAADFLNAGHFQAVSLQHEFGIFGGEAGNHIMALLSRLTHADCYDASHRSRRTQASAAQRAEKSHRCLLQGHRHGGESPELAAYRISCAGGQDRDHPAWNSRHCLRRTRCRQGRAGLRRQTGYFDVRSALAQQGHRSHDRRNAVDP